MNFICILGVIHKWCLLLEGRRKVASMDFGDILKVDFGITGRKILYGVNLELTVLDLTQLYGQDQ